MANLNRVRMERIRADALTIHPVAQGSLKPAYVAKLSENFDLDAVGVIHVVRYARNGKIPTFVVDGQHRVESLMRLGFGEWVVDVMLHVDVKDDRRAHELYLRLNDRHSVSAYDKFLNELGARQPEAVGVNDIALKYGLKIGFQTADGCLACPASLKKAYRLNEGEALNRGLGWITHAWGKAANALEGNLIQGAALVAAANNGNIEDDAMIKKLAKYPGGPSTLIGHAKTRTTTHRSSLARAIAGVVIDTYNLGRRGGKLDPL